MLAADECLVLLGRPLDDGLQLAHRLRRLCHPHLQILRLRRAEAGSGGRQARRRVGCLLLLDARRQLLKLPQPAGGGGGDSDSGSTASKGGQRPVAGVDSCWQGPDW